MTERHPDPAQITCTAPAYPDRPRIYVACLAADSNGCLHGSWITATTQDEIRTQVRAMLAASPIPNAEEWAIHDCEGFEGAHLSEYASFETVCELADFIKDHGELGAITLADPQIGPRKIYANLAPVKGKKGRHVILWNPRD